MKPSFREYLREKFVSQYDGQDFLMQFEEEVWFANISVDQVIEWAEEWGKI